MALASSGRDVITDAAKAAEQRQNIRTDSRVFFTGPPQMASIKTTESSIPDCEEPHHSSLQAGIAIGIQSTSRSRPTGRADEDASAARPRIPRRRKPPALRPVDLQKHLHCPWLHTRSF